MTNKKFFIFCSFSILILNQVVLSQASGPIALTCNDKYTNSICFSKGGSLIAYNDYKNIQIRNTNDTSLFAFLSNGHKDRILSLDISSDSSMVVSGGRDSLIILWDINIKKIIKKLDYPAGKVNTVRFDPTGNYIYSGSTDKRVTCYSIKEDRIIFDKKIHFNDILSMDISSDGKILVTAGGDKNVIILDARNGDEIQNLGHFKNWIRCVRFSPDGSGLAICCDNGFIYFWRRRPLQDFEFVSKERFSRSWITSVDFSNDISSFVYSCENGISVLNSFGNSYIYKAGYPIRMIIVQPKTGIYLTVAIATTGDGVLIVKAKSLFTKR